MLNTPIAKVLKFDYRMDGFDQIICVTTDGSVRGYTLQNQKAAKGEAFGSDDTEKLNEIYNDLLKKKKVVYFL